MKITVGQAQHVQPYLECLALRIDTSEGSICYTATAGRTMPLSNWRRVRHPDSHESLLQRDGTVPDPADARGFARVGDRIRARLRSAYSAFGP